MKFIAALSILLLFLISCQTRKADERAANDPQAIMDRAIAVHGGQKYESINVSFDFREKHFTARRKNGLFTYSRTFTDSTGKVHDVLTNTGFIRTLNGIKQTLTSKQIKDYSAAVNSVIYFALLPHGLNDPAVQKKYAGTNTIKKQPYHKIQVTFKQEGGGEHFQDQFFYWINQQTGTMDYFSYTEGGIRFREAINPQVVNGIRFQDYINYKTSDSLRYPEIEKLYEAGKLEILSRIELKNIRVQIQ